MSDRTIRCFWWHLKMNNDDVINHMALENRLKYIRSFRWHLLRGRSVATVGRSAGQCQPGSKSVFTLSGLLKFACKITGAAFTFGTRALASNCESKRLLAPNLWFQDLFTFGAQSLQLPFSPEFPPKKWLFQAATNVIFWQLSAKLSKTVPSGYTASYKYLARKCAVLGHRAPRWRPSSRVWDRVWDQTCTQLTSRDWFFGQVLRPASTRCELIIF